MSNRFWAKNVDRVVGRRMKTLVVTKKGYLSSQILANLDRKCLTFPFGNVIPQEMNRGGFFVRVGYAHRIYMRIGYAHRN